MIQEMENYILHCKKYKKTQNDNQKYKYVI